MDISEDKNIYIKFEVDPDYENTNTAIRNVELKEEEENKLTEEKLRKIIREEFDNELSMRQKQLEEIEEKVFKAQKLLHIIRYVLISTYYNNKSLEYESAGSSSLESINILTDQNRIHPAIKKLIGSNVNSLKFLASRTKRKVPTKSDTSISPVYSKRIKLDSKEEFKHDKNSISIKKTEVPLTENSNLDVPTNRKKTQHRVVVGNISYFKKSLEQDNLTHKWMVYVKLFRGSKDGLEVSSLIHRVVFYLHPSYKPHDVVEVSNPPFHLSRRGWGEFPLRVQIFFKSMLNKPIDVIHTLKLDKTFSERQTLGNETVASIFLYDDGCSNLKFESSGNQENNKFETEITSHNSYHNINNNVKEEVFDIKEEIVLDEYIIEASPVKQQNHLDEHLCEHDHCYSLPYTKEGQINTKKHKSPVKQVYNELIYGLGPDYLNPYKQRKTSVASKANRQSSGSPSAKNNTNVFKVLKTVTGQSIRFLPESFNQVLLSNGNVVSIKFLKSPTKTGQTFTTNKAVMNLQNKLSGVEKPKVGQPGSGISVKDLIRQEKILLKLPKHKFKNMGEALPYLFKRLPLWTSDANIWDYKSTYPFSARSREEYNSWPMGKKLAAEWCRAKTIKRIVSGEPFSKSWSTKAIFMYARSHLFNPPVPSYMLFRNESEEKRALLNCYFENSIPNGYPKSELMSENETLSILSPEKDITETQTNNGTYIDISDKELARECAFVKETALDVGIVLKCEEIIKGVVVNASERVILEAVKCLIENLIRRSHFHLVCGNSYNEKTAYITTTELRKTLEERAEFRSIREFEESKITKDFFS